METFDTIRTKRSIRRFAPTPLPDDAVRRILEAGRHSGSSMNEQPWIFVAVRDRDTLLALSEVGDHAGHLAGAALGVAIVTPPLDPEGWLMFDVGQAATQMMLAAWAEGIGSCIASVYRHDDARRILGLPADRTVDCLLSFGYPAEPPRPPRAGGRQPFDRVVRWERW